MRSSTIGSGRSIGSACSSTRIRRFAIRLSIFAFPYTPLLYSMSRALENDASIPGRLVRGGVGGRPRREDAGERREAIVDRGRDVRSSRLRRRGEAPETLGDLRVEVFTRLGRRRGWGALLPRRLGCARGLRRERVFPFGRRGRLGRGLLRGR